MGPGGYRGWADRFAQRLAAERPGLRYANLAGRGRVVADVAADQVPLAIAMAPDLVSIAAGGNDLLRPGADPDALALAFEAIVADLRADLRPGHRVHRVRPAHVPADPADPRQGGGLQHAPARDRRPLGLPPGGPVVDAGARRPARVEPGPAAPELGRSPPRGPAGLRGRGGERRGGLARAAAAAAGRTAGGQDRGPVPGRGPGPEAWLSARRQDARWARQHAVPWASRRLRGVSSGDGIPPKRPEMLPL